MGYHLSGITKNKISSNLIISGSPERIKKVQSFLERSEVVSNARGFLVISGYYRDVYISACSVGIGGPSLAIAVEELIQFGGKTIIRVGSCGVLLDSGKPGDIFVSIGCVRHDGTSKKYLPLEFPAIPDYGLTCKLIRETEKAGASFWVGLGTCNDVFYKPKKSMEDQEKRKLMERINVLFGEMECATLFTLGLYHNIKTAAILVSDSSHKIKKDDNKIDCFEVSETLAIKIALDTLVENALNEK